MRFDLGDEDYANLRHPNKIPRGLAVKFRQTIYALANTTEDLNATAPDAELRAAQAVLRSERGMSVFEDMKAALVIAAVSEWSFGEVSLENLDNVPDSCIEAIYTHCNEQGYAETLMPDFTVSPDEDSPTTPS